MTNTQNTTMAIAARTTAGAGALAPAPEVLTINQPPVRIYLKRTNAVGRALEHFRVALQKSSTESPEWDHNWEAVELLRFEWNDLVFGLRERGGLLHLGRGV